MQSIATKLSKAPDGMIGDGVHIAYQWIDKRLCRIYVGTRQSGPILQYDAPDDFADVPHYQAAGKALPHPSKHYDGNDHVNMSGAWTPIYSRGDYGKRYAFGGHWSPHSKSLHPRIANSCRQTATKMSHIIVTDDGYIEMPPGISTDLTMYDIDCSVGWAIWYPTAREAMAARLSLQEIPGAALPSRSRIHLISTESNAIRDNINDVIAAYNL